MDVTSLPQDAQTISFTTSGDYDDVILYNDRDLIIWNIQTTGQVHAQPYLTCEGKSEIVGIYYGQAEVLHNQDVHYHCNSNLHVVTTYGQGQQSITFTYSYNPPPRINLLDMSYLTMTFFIFIIIATISYKLVR